MGNLLRFEKKKRMKVVVCVISFFVLFSIALGESAVLSLTPTNYESVLSKGNVFVKYFSPNCGHCKAVAPTYEQLAKDFAKYPEKVKIAEVDCLAHDAICKAAGVKGWPTIHYYKSGKNDYDEYEGDRSIENFSQFLSTRIGIHYKTPVAKTIILTPDNFESVVYNTSVNAFVAFTAPWCGHCKNFKPQLEMAAQSFTSSDPVVFGNFDADTHKDFAGIKKFEIHSFPTIRFFPSAQPGETVVEESEKAGKLYKGNQLIEAYESERSASGVVNYVNARSGTYRVVGGGIQEFAGLESALVQHVQNLTAILKGANIAEGELDAQKLAALAALKTIKNKYVSAQYERYINKIVGEGAAGLSYAKTEHARITRLLENSSLSDQLKLELTVRKNVLGLFNNLSNE